MKVYIPNSDEITIGCMGGKGLFCYKLGRQLRKMGVDVTGDDSKNVDIALNVIRLSHKRAKINVLRLNGVYHNTAQNYEKKNANIKKSLQECDAVVYQSLHALRLCDAFIGEANASVPRVIIYNGSEIVKRRVMPHVMIGGKLEPFNKKKTVIAFSKWRPHKRLQDIINCFLLAEVPDSRLCIVGDITKSGLCPREIVRTRDLGNVHFLGQLDQNALYAHLRLSDLSIHLCWFDACPNSVVEALCHGVPVISNNVGGTRELLMMCGLSELVCKIDDAYAYKPVDLYNPPEIDRSIVAEKIRLALSTEIHVSNQALSIKTIAKEYLDFFESLM